MTYVYKLYTYDLWGNDEDGYTVNDVYPQGEIELNDTTDAEIAKVVGIEGSIEVDGEEDYTLYVNALDVFKPLCELRFERVEQ